VALGFAKQSLAKCISQHKCRSKDTTALPIRVVYVGSHNDDVKLVIPGTRRDLYICLSHCWGRIRPLRTTKDTLAQRLRAIPFSELPKTFLEAIQFTRALGLRFIWIDSLCIVQDDTDDWIRESARMASIFQNSTLTIAATAGLDSRAGLYRDTATKVEVTNIRATASLSVFVRPEIFHTDTSTDIEDVPLFGRGWILQERILSPRVLHFGPTELFWECRQKYWCQCGDSEPEDIELTKPAFYSLLTSSVSSDIHHAWRDLIEEYSQLSLTVSSDKLHAVAGLKTDMAARRDPDAKYAFGIWTDSLKMDLVWKAFVGPGTKARRSYRTGNWRAPSWSWASVDAEIMWPQSKGRWYRNGCSHSEQMCFNARLLATELETLDSLDSEAKARHPTLEVATPQPIDLIADHNFHHSSSTTPPFPPPPLLQFFTKTHQIQDKYYA